VKAGKSLTISIALNALTYSILNGSIAKMYLLKLS